VLQDQRRLIELQLSAVAHSADVQICCVPKFKPRPKILPDGIRLWLQPKSEFFSKNLAEIQIRPKFWEFFGI